MAPPTPPSPRARLLLIRHAATPMMAEDRFAGSSDPPLSAEGVAEAAALAQRLSHTSIAAAYCSPMVRAVQTAEAVAAPHGLTPNPVADLREVDHGHWEGLAHRDVVARYPAELARWEADPYTFAPDRGETGRSVLARALPAIRRIVMAHPSQTVLVVSHKATIRLVASALFGMDPRHYRDRLAQEAACLNIIEFEAPATADAVLDRPRLILWNDTSHSVAGR